jgi:TetR/AcrR family transcriptional regulator, transcriptional repressor for nem operon
MAVSASYNTLILDPEQTVLMPKTKQFDEAEVLQKARDVFWEKGYNGTSMDELVQATGLSRSSIYDTFGDKHGLYLRSLEQYRQEELRRVNNSFPRNTTARKKIELFFRKNADDILQDKQRRGCFILNSTTELANMDSATKNLVGDNMDRMEELFYTWVREGQSAGNISTRFTARALARHLFSSSNGLRIAGQTRQDKKTLDDIVRLALSVLD